MTYPKDGERKLRETIRQLKMEVGRLRKENSTLQIELENRSKPERSRKEREPTEQKPKQEVTPDQWRENFIKQFKPGRTKRQEDDDEKEK